MRRILIIITLLLSANAFASEPESLKLWKAQSDFFWKMDFSNEELFKVNLSNYYTRIYTGDMLERVLQWVNNGRLGSEYYSGRFSELRDTEINNIEPVKKGLFRVKAIQKSCYNLNYNHLDLDTLVIVYKVSNYTQIQVDEWLASIPPESDNAEICLNIAQEINLHMGAKREKILSEKWNIINSSLKLKPNQVLK